jgi:protein-tyrosine phosphatase
MPTHTWWIDEPRVRASGNPSDEDFARLRVQGFSVLVALMGDKEPLRYDKDATVAAGWECWPIPAGEGGAPSLAQLSDFTAQMKALPEGKKVLIHCQTGAGRSAFMGTVYWIANGLTARQAIERVQQSGVEPSWVTPEREDLLRQFEQLQGVPEN